MKRKLLFVLAVLSLCVVLAACKKQQTDSLSTPAEPEVTATPEPSLEPYKANVLTGEPQDADYKNQRITAVMVNNIVAARPQRGLSKADILFEIKVEGGITRFMPVFTDYQDIGEIGPVRSGRDPVLPPDPALAGPLHPRGSVGGHAAVCHRLQLRQPEQQRRCQRLPRLRPRELGGRLLQQRQPGAGAHDVHQLGEHPEVHRRQQRGYEPHLQLHLLQLRGLPSGPDPRPVQQRGQRLQRQVRPGGGRRRVYRDRAQPLLQDPLHL